MLTLHVCDCHCLSKVPESLKYFNSFLCLDHRPSVTNFCVSSNGRFCSLCTILLSTHKSVVPLTFDQPYVGLLPQDSNLSSGRLITPHFKTGPGAHRWAKMICYLNNVGAGCEYDNYVGLKIAMTPNTRYSLICLELCN